MQKIFSVDIHLHKDGAVWQALGVHLPAHVVEVDALADVSPCVLYRGVAVHVGQLAQAEPNKHAETQSVDSEHRNESVD